MRKLIFIALGIILAMCPLTGLSQGTTGFHRIGQVLKKSPSNLYVQAVPYATVTVTDSSTGLPATIYSDPALTVKITPPVVTADGDGNYDYYFSANLCVTEDISSVSQGEWIVTNVCNNTAGLANPVIISEGGTGATTAAGARTNLGVAASGANSDITSLSGLSTPISIAEGGTGTATTTANYVFAGPATGAPGAPSFRGLVSADIPNNAANTSGNASTATALAAVPTQCTGTNFATGIQANGNANCATPPSTAAITQIGGAGSDATTPAGGGIQPLTLNTVNAGPGSCGDATHVCNVVTNGKGLVTSQSQIAITGMPSSRTCNVNGCYIQYADGTFEMWGQTGNASSGGAANLTATFPTSFTTTTNLQIVATAQGAPTGDGNPHPADCHVVSFTTAGATIVIALPVQIGGSGYSSLNTNNYCSYHAFGN